VGTIVRRASGGCLLALENGFAAFDPDTGELDFLVDPEADLPDNRFNDGKCDPAGRFWAGTMSLSHKPRPLTGSLYSLDAEGRVQTHLTGIGVSNGIVWTSDASTMYYIDTVTRCVDAFDFDNQKGEISNRRSIVNVPDELGSPDGMAIDAEDKIWVAFYGGWCVARFDPATGKMVAQIKMPVSNVTACAFGGPDLDLLYITTARQGLDEAALAEQPQAGDLFAAQPGVPGVETPMYAG
jgi:sugar lactone lactonase YvrE